MGATLFDPLYRGLENVLDLRMRQHALTASNLANTDTPGFKAKVVPFDELLPEVMGTGDGLSLRRTDARHFGLSDTDPDGEIIELDPAPWSTDGNSVYAEREVARLNANSLMFNGVVRGVSKRLAMLKYAANDGR